MNVERLYAIARALQRELEGSGVLPGIAQLTSSLQNLVNQPQTAQYQQEVSDTLARIRNGLTGQPSDEFSASWRQTLEELEIEDVLGQRLLDSINTSIRENQLTPAVALTEITALNQRLVDVSETFDKLIEAFDHLGISSEEDLRPGDVELSFLIPRQAVSNELVVLGREFVNIERIVGPFLELTSESRPNLQVRAIASSDFGLYLDMPTQAAAVFAGCVAYLMTQYKQFLEIRRLKQDLENNDVPPDILQKLSAHADERMKEAIQAEVDRVLSGVVRGGREHELRIELERSLTQIAVRIDRGYSIDVRVGEDEAVDEEEGDEAVELSPDQVAVNLIREVSSDLKFIRPSGRPILTLLPGGMNDDPEGDDGVA